MNFEAFFLPAPDGQRFCIHHPAQGTAAHGAVVYLHPFAEEMHKSRRMAALQARALASNGFSVLQIDLLGCGDSSGDFGDACWDAWINDVLRAVVWLRQRTDAPLWLWGLRTGALLASDAAARLDEPVGLLVWNPASSGKQYLQQFLRLKVAGEMLAGESKGAMDEIRRTLAAGQAVEVAGYRLSAAMAEGLEHAELKPGAAIRAVRWLETSTRPEPELSPAARIAIEKWQTACPDVSARPVNGPAFWQTTEIEDAPLLIEATLAELRAAP